jgi:hypothetical protein
VSSTIKKDFKVQFVTLMREMINAYTILIGKLKEKRIFEAPTHG